MKFGIKVKMLTVYSILNLCLKFPFSLCNDLKMGNLPMNVYENCNFLTLLIVHEIVR